MNADLFGKEIRQPKPWEPFYCSACAGTQRRTCPHGFHYCRKCKEAGGKECPVCSEDDK